MYEDEDPQAWKIDYHNCLEFVEAICVSEYIDEELCNELINKYGHTNSEEGSKYLDFDQCVQHMMKVVVVDRKIPFDELFNFDDYSLPIDRISKFLRMLKMDLEHKKNCLHGDGLSMIEERYLKEIEFTQHKINQRAIFNSSVTAI